MVAFPPVLQLRWSPQALMSRGSRNLRNRLVNFHLLFVAKVSNTVLIVFFRPHSQLVKKYITLIDVCCSIFDCMWGGWGSSLWQHGLIWTRSPVASILGGEAFTSWLVEGLQWGCWWLVPAHSHWLVRAYVASTSWRHCSRVKGSVCFCIVVKWVPTTRYVVKINIIYRWRYRSTSSSTSSSSSSSSSSLHCM